MTALEIFRMVAIEFAEIPDDNVVDEDTGKVVKAGVISYMELYSSQISKKRFGSTYERALAYLTAHKLKMLGYGNDENGTIADSLRVSSFSEGESSISFSTNQQTNLQPDAEYALTVYGLEFLTLKRQVIVPIVSAGEGFVCR